MNYQVIIPAAGSGKRMGAGFNKLFIPIKERPIISYTLDFFHNDDNCINIILVIDPKDEDQFQEIINTESYEKIIFAYGGKERQHSVYNGLQKAKKEGIILVHDGARPFIKKETVEQLVQTSYQYGGAIAAVPVKDTIKKAYSFEVVETIDRTSLWQTQTPQAFRFSILEEAHEKAKQDGFLGTDESSLVERLGYPVKIVQSDYDNIKLTTPEDIYFAHAILEKRAQMQYNKQED